jgi:hypothetical protein
MSSALDPIDVDAQSDDSHLTTAVSGETPTLPSGEAPQIKALEEAADDAAYELLYAQIPQINKTTVAGIRYIYLDPYRTKKSKRKAWYWKPEHGVELVRVTKGTLIFTPLISALY